MSFVARLRPELICIDPPWQTFAQTAAGLIAILARQGTIAENAAAAACEAVIAREQESSTALLDIAVGVPHARLPGLAAPLSALAVASRGLYEAVPTVPIQIVALVLSPPAASDQHLQVLAGIATLLRSSSLRRKLLQSTSSVTALDILLEHGLR